MTDSKVATYSSPEGDIFFEGVISRGDIFRAMRDNIMSMSSNERGWSNLSALGEVLALLYVLARVNPAVLDGIPQTLAEDE